jgi:hypothetical protein
MPSSLDSILFVVTYTITATGMVGMDAYRLENIGAWNFSFTSALDPSAVTGVATSNGNINILGPCSSAPHIDAAFDITQVGTTDDMHEFAIGWEDAGTLRYHRAGALNLKTGFPYSSAGNVTTAHYSDIAFYTLAGTGGTDEFIAMPFGNTTNGNLAVFEEEQVGGGTFTNIRPLHSGVSPYSPRIAAIDEMVRVGPGRLWPMSIPPARYAKRLDTIATRVPVLLPKPICPDYCQRFTAVRPCLALPVSLPESVPRMDLGRTSAITSIL